MKDWFYILTLCGLWIWGLILCALCSLFEWCWAICILLPQKYGKRMQEMFFLQVQGSYHFLWDLAWGYPRPLQHTHNLHMFSQQGKMYALSAHNTVERERSLNNFSPERVADVFSGLRTHQRLSLFKLSMAGPWPGTGESHTHCPGAVVPMQPLQGCMLTPEGLTPFPTPTALAGASRRMLLVQGQYVSAGSSAQGRYSTGCSVHHDRRRRR